jgi:hypothetical protein
MTRAVCHAESGFSAAWVYGRDVGGAGSTTGMIEHGGAHNYHVAQASGMVSVQAHCTVVEAFTKIEERAELIDLTVEEVADSVLHRQFRFSSNS